MVTCIRSATARAHRVMLRTYSWPYTQELLLVALRDPKGCRGSNLGWLCTKQVPSPLSHGAWGTWQQLVARIFLMHLQEGLQSVVLASTPTLAQWGARAPVGPAPARMPHTTSAIAPASSRHSPLHRQSPASSPPLVALVSCEPSRRLA